MSHPPSTLSPPPNSAGDTIDRFLGEESFAKVQHHTAWIQQLMGSTMREGEHYGRIAGCNDKPTLFKPGAEKLIFALRWAPSYEVKEKHLEGGHRDYHVVCTLSCISTSVVFGQGVGLCSTLESRYRYQDGGIEPTERLVPSAYWDARQAGDDRRMAEALGGSELTITKTDNGWRIARCNAPRVENADIADTYNMVLKMAKKRALVDAVLTATASSDLFTQDLEDRSGQPGSRGGQPPTPTSSSPSAPPVAEAKVVPLDDACMEFRDIHVHFGKNRGLTLSELTKQQIHWYETEWMPKREQSGSATAKDLVLMRALKAYRSWREAEKAGSASLARAA